MFDYRAVADLFRQRSRRHPKQIAYRRFANAADAIQFAIEALPPAQLHGTFIEANDQRLGGRQIRELYEDERFPLPRRLGNA